MGKHRRAAALLAAGCGCGVLWVAGFCAPAFPQVPRETRSDLLFVALFVSLLTAGWLALGPLKRRVGDIEDGIGDAHERVQRIRGRRTGSPVHAVADPESSAS